MDSHLAAALNKPQPLQILPNLLGPSANRKQSVCIEVGRNDGIVDASGVITHNPGSLRNRYDFERCICGRFSRNKSFRVGQPNLDGAFSPTVHAFDISLSLRIYTKVSTRLEKKQERMLR